MGVPTISERKYYRLVNSPLLDYYSSDWLTRAYVIAKVPSEAAEPTSTIVLTSQGSYFVDVRILRSDYEKEKDKGVYSQRCLDWAFAGRSRTHAGDSRKDQMIKMSHTVWDHWIDSKSNDPEPDEGDMWVQPDGDVLERGTHQDPITGVETEYEELWHDLEVDAIRKKQDHSSLVVHTNDPGRNIRGMAVKIGGWCQGIMKIGDDLTVERWQRKPKEMNSDEAETEGSDREERTRNDWIRTFRIGKEVLPCEEMCSRTMGKLGLHTVLTFTTMEEEPDKDINWEVLEEY